MYKLTKLPVTVTVGLFLMVVAVFFVATGVMSQDVATGSATATVQAPLTVTSAQALDFGTVYQGVAKSIASDNANAGVFSIVGQAGAGIALYLALPEYVALASGVDRMTIAFAPGTCEIDTLAARAPLLTPADVLNAAQGFANVDPHALPSGVSIGSPAGANDTTAVYLGGRVVPSLNQTAGAYSGAVILTVSYTGI